MTRAFVMLSALLLASTFGLGVQAQEPMPFGGQINPATSANPKRVLEVTAVEVLTVTIENDGRIVIVAVGTVPTGGWSNPKLDPWLYVTPPPDGIYDFDFVATPPASGMIVTQVITKVIASYVIWAPPKGFAGVKVHSQSNSIVATVR